MKQEHKDLKIAMDSLKLELKKIKIRSLYKGIIDIFCSVYDLGLEGNYYQKLNNLLYELEKLTENDKIKELKEFLMDVYFYLQRGNCLAHSIDEDTTPLEMIFTLIEKGRKKNYSNTKKLLLELSFDEILSHAIDNYNSLKNKEKLIEAINISRKELEQQLL